MAPTPEERQLAGSFEELLATARKGSQEALGQVLDLCRPYLLLVANRELPEEVRARLGPSDVVQQTCVEAVGAFPAFTGTKEADLLAWLRMVLLNNVRNTVRDHRAKKRAVGREVGLPDGAPEPAGSREPSPSSALGQRERDEALIRAVEQLPGVERQLIQWRVYEELSFEEIGQRLGKSSEAARKQFVRTVDKLGEVLKPLNESS